MNRGKANQMISESASFINIILEGVNCPKNPVYVHKNAVHMLEIMELLWNSEVWVLFLDILHSISRLVSLKAQILKQSL